MDWMGYVWLGLLVAFLVLEGQTAAVVSIWFAGGALAALITTLITPVWWVQLVVFLVVSALLLALLRPFTGGGTMAVGSEIIAAAGPDSFVGRVAAVMLGSSETSFYVVAVYSACLGMKNTRYALPAALCADLAAFLAAAWAVRLMMA